MLAHVPHKVTQNLISFKNPWIENKFSNRGCPHRHGRSAARFEQQRFAEMSAGTNPAVRAFDHGW